MTAGFATKLILLAVAAAALGAELATRAITDRPWATVSVADQRLGYRLLPDQDVTGPRGTRVTINSHGFRDREWGPATAGELRVALLGKSITFGSYVSIEETWGRRLEELLQEHSGRPVTVMNFAVAGYRLEQMERVLQDRVSAFEPELVILPVTADVVWPMPKSLVADPKPIECFVRRTALHSLVDKELRVFWPADGLWPEGGRPSAADLRRRGQPLAAVPPSGDPLAPNQAALWEQAEASLARMRTRVAEWGGKFAVVALPLVSDGFRPEPSPQAQRWNGMVERCGGIQFIDPRPDFLAGMQPLLDELQLHELDVENMPYRHWVGLGDADLAQAASSLVLLHSPTHYSPIGHQVLARSVAQALEASR